MLSLINFILLYSGEKGGLLDINPGLIFWTIITFLILLFILKRIAWKPILQALAEREENIRASLEKAEQARREAELILQENSRRLAEAEEQVKKIINEGREYSNKLRTEILEKANQEAKRMIDLAQQEIERKKEEALDELREVVSELSIQAAEKILEKSIDKEENKKIVEKLIQNISKG